MFLASPLTAQEEVFEEVDPYTEGEPERLGYVSYGPFPWVKGHTSLDVRDTVGATSILFLETEHFRIASTLETYEPQGDREEKEHLEAEFDRLKERLGRFKPPKGEIDPWLRLHLYAQRLEEQYADFRDRFGFSDEDFVGPDRIGKGPYLGQEDKYVVLLSQTQSVMGRYLQRYIGSTNEFSYRWNFGNAYFLCLNQEALFNIKRELDICMHVPLAASLAINLVEAFQGTGHDAPAWLKFGLSHYYARRIDPRYPVWSAGGATNWQTDRQWVWEPRVRGLVENEVAGPWEDMFAWRASADIKDRDHMIAWSRVRWLLEEEPDGLRTLLLRLTAPLEGETEEEKAAFYLARQHAAFEQAYGRSVDELDADWAKHVRRKYAKK